MTRVVHCLREPYDTYIGREHPRYGLPQSKWANPYPLARNATLEQRLLVIARFRDEHLARRPDLVAAIPELDGKVLGCWCAPLPCHGDVLADLVESSVRPVTLLSVQRDIERVRQWQEARAEANKQETVARAEEARAERERLELEHRLQTDAWRQHQIEANPQRHTCGECGYRSYRRAEHAADCSAGVAPLITDTRYLAEVHDATDPYPQLNLRWNRRGEQVIGGHVTRHRPRDMSPSDVFGDPG